jgi:TolB-like protein
MIGGFWLKFKLVVPWKVEDVMNKIHESLENDGFVVSKEEATYVVEINEGKAHKTKNWLRFWSRKGSLDKQHPDYSLVIRGEITAEGEKSIVNAELIEYHGSRPHTYGGTAWMDKYFDNFCKIFEE